MVLTLLCLYSSCTLLTLYLSKQSSYTDILMNLSLLFLRLFEEKIADIELEISTINNRKSIQSWDIFFLKANLSHMSYFFFTMFSNPSSARGAAENT